MLTIRAWGTEEFAAAADLWRDLLQRSAADPLFMSWEWQWNWWRHHAGPLRGELLLLAAYDCASQLVGLAPLYVHRGSHRGLPVTRIESLGSAWRTGADVFSEYLDLIVDARHQDAFLGVLAEYLLADQRWSDFVFANTRIDSHAARLVQHHLGAALYVRNADPLVAYAAPLPGDFAQYVQSLNRAARRRVWNQRRKLGRAELLPIDEAGVPGAFEQLNRFHSRRWGSVHYTGLRRAFHQRFAVLMSRRQALRMTQLRRDGRTLSIMYNIRVGATEYNVQSGFDVAASRGLSPGYLHFGYCIEQACIEGVRDFDFLAGPGLHREYKGDFCTVRTCMVTLQAIRARPLAWIYRRYDRRRALQAGRLRT